MAAARGRWALTRNAQARSARGYFGVGIENTKCAANIGTLWRSAFCFDAAFLFTIGRRYHKQASDTVQSWRHVPLYNFQTFDQFYESMPHDCQLVGVELDDRAAPLRRFHHPERCIYLLGAEDHGLSKEARQRCHKLVVLPGRYCLNVAVAGSVVLHHRHDQRESNHGL
jgi:tRNA G18 (ribose-2'-O)-methylase SpoU